jgi:predicted transcriptional regulator
MSSKFVVRPKQYDSKEDRSVIMTVRIDRKLQESYDDLANKSNRSRNELINMALQYAIENLEFIEGDPKV